MAVSNQMNEECVKEIFYDLVLKKNISVRLGEFDVYIDLIEQGDYWTMLCQLQENVCISHALLDKLSTSGLAFDRKTNCLYFAQKQPFHNENPSSLALCILKFYSKLQALKKELNTDMETSKVLR